MFDNCSDESEDFSSLEQSKVGCLQYLFSKMVHLILFQVRERQCFLAHHIIEEREWVEV